MTYSTRIKFKSHDSRHYNGESYDSKFEAGVAVELDAQLKNGEIKDWERQFKVDCIPYDCNGDPVTRLAVYHKVDFRVHNLDGSFLLIEAKGAESADYSRRRKWLESFFLTANPDHEYLIVKEGKKKPKRWNS